MAIEMTAEDFAKSSKLFEFLDETGQNRLMDIAREESVGEGDVLCTEGELGEVFWVILEGEVRVDVDDFGEAKEVARLGAGQFCGEISGVLNQPRSATMTALSGLKLLAFDREPVLDILAEYPKVMDIVAKVGLMRSEDTVEKLMGD